MEFKYAIILVCLVFMVFLTIKEMRRKDKSRLIGRVLASILMITSFALLIIPISYSIKKEEPAGQLNLLTEGTSLDTILALKAAKYDLDSTLFPNLKKLKINHLADLNYYLKAHPEIKEINIYGYGFGNEELKTLKDYHVSFHPSAIPSGIISASWPKRIKASEQLTIQGAYHNSTNKAIKLKFSGLGASLDSVTIKANTKINFSFTNQPKQIGKAVFNLIALQDKDTLSIEPIPFEVENKQPIRVLILASFPDFEYKFLKKWLFENQFPVAFRSQISKNKYSTEFLNSNAINLNRINQELLRNIDLVICDEDELSNDIYNAVNNGMGLIIRVNSPKTKSTYETLSSEKPLSLTSSDQLKFNNLPFTQTLFLKSVTDHQPLLTDEKGKIIVDSRLNGMGKIITTTLASTYQWQLAGKQVDYSRFWSLLFANSLRKKMESQSFEIVPQWPTINEKMRLKVNLTDSKPPVISIDSISIAPRQNMELPFIWDGFFWLKKVGWTILSLNRKAHNIYSYKKTDWHTAKNFTKLKTTADFVAHQKNKDLKEDRIEHLTTEELSKLWFFAVFLTTISFLWYEQRFLMSK